MCLGALTQLLSQTGLFFGEVEGAVMNKLLQMGSFKRSETQYNISLKTFKSILLRVSYFMSLQPLLLCLHRRITLYDYQALCKEYAGSSDSARTLADVSVQDRTSAGRYTDRNIRDNHFIICGTLQHIYIYMTKVKITSIDLDSSLWVCGEPCLHTCET